MAKLGDLVVRIGADTRGLNKSLGKVQRNMRSMTGNLTKLGTSMSKAVTLPLLAIGAASLKMSVDFEASMAKVKAVSGAGVEDFAALEDSAKKLGASTTFTASEVAGLQLIYAKFGYTATQINAVTESTLYLAQATGSDLAEAAGVAATTLGGFGLGASDVTRVTDVMAAAFTGSALDIDKFKDSMKFVAPIAKVAGVSIEEASSMLATLADAGISGSQAGTALRRILMELSGESGTAAEKLAKLSAKGLGVKDAFDEVGRNASSALLVLSAGAKDIPAFTEELENSGGAAKAMADIMNDNAAGALKKMTSALEGLGISIGTMLAPMFEGVVDTVTSLATWFNNLSSGWKKLIIIVSTFLAALGPMLIILPKLIGLFGLMRAAILSMNLAMLANPFVLAAVAIAGITAAVVGYNLASATAVKKTRQFRKELGLLSLEQQKELLEKSARDILPILEGLQSEVAEKQKEWDDNFNKWKSRADKEKLRRQLTGAKAVLDAFTKENGMYLEELNRVNSEIKKLSDQKNKEEDDAAKKAAGTPGSLDALKATVSALTKEMWGLDMASEEFKTTQDKLKIATKELDDALASLEDKLPVVVQLTDALGNVFDVSESGSLLAFLDEFGLAVQNTTEVVADSVDTMANSINEAVSDAVGTMISGVAEMVGTAIGAQKPIEGVGKFLGNVLGDMAINLGTYAIMHGTVIELIKKSLIDLGGVKAILAGIALVALGAGIKGHISRSATDAGVPALAEGGLAYGPTLAMVGDNKGANIDPEVVAPLSKLKGMLGGNTVQVYGRISGDDIVISNSRASRDRNRF